MNVPSPSCQRSSLADASWTGILLVGLAFLLALNELADYDAWWHLKTGQLLPTLGWPSTDWYCFSSTDRVWIDVHWGFQWLVATVYGAGGVAGLVVMQASLVSLTMAVMLLARRPESPAWFSWMIFFVALIAMSGRFNVRPELLSMLFLAIDLAILLRSADRPHLLWALIPIQVFWSNVQSLYVFGPILMGIFLLEAIIGGPARRVGTLRLSVVAGLVFASCLVSPYGIQNVLFLFDVFQKIDPQSGQIYRESIGELVPMPILIADGGYRAGYIAMTLLLAPLALVSVVVDRQAIFGGRAIFRLLPLIAFGFFAWQSVRNVGHWAIVASMLSVANFGPHITWSMRPLFVRSLALMVTLMVGLAWMGGTWSFLVRSDRQFGVGLHRDHFSLAAMDLCAKPGMPMRAAVFHLGHAANYIFACGPERKVLMDPRLEVNSEQTYRQYREIQASLEQGTTGGLVMLDALDVPLVVADGQNNLGMQATLLASPLWRCIHWDHVAAVFVRATYPLPAEVRPFDFLEGLFDVGSDEAVGFDRGGAGGTRVRPSGSDRRDSIRLVYLAQALMAKPGAPAELIEKVLWRALRLSIMEMRGEYETGGSWRGRFSEYHEQRRAFAAALLLMERLLISGIDKGEINDPARWLGGYGRAWARRVLNENPGDTMLSLIFAESLVDVGAIDESIDVLEAIGLQPAISRMEKQLRNDIDQAIGEKQRQLESRPLPTNPPEMTVVSFDSYVKAGRAGAFAQAIAGIEKNREQVPIEERMKLSERLWRFDALIAQKVVGGKTLLSPDRIQPIRDDGANEQRQVQQSLFRVVFAALAEDRHALERTIAEVPTEDLSPADQRWLKQARDLLLQEANPR
ncbi:hypothetical protein K2X85_09605 [bacterium]|nr:hypothetical protein [bacterium]